MKALCLMNPKHNFLHLTPLLDFGLWAFQAGHYLENISCTLDMKMESLIMQLQKDIIFWALSVCCKTCSWPAATALQTRQAIWAYIGTSDVYGYVLISYLHLECPSPPSRTKKLRSKQPNSLILTGIGPGNNAY